MYFFSILLSSELYDSLHAEAFNKGNLQKVEISRQARLDVLLRCDAPEVAGVLQYSRKNEREKNGRDFRGEYNRFQDDLFLTIRLFEI